VISQAPAEKGFDKSPQALNKKTQLKHHATISQNQLKITQQPILKLPFAAFLLPV